MTNTIGQTTLKVSDVVQSALDEKRPVLALESTIFTHGLPRPTNIDVAREAEEIVRKAGVTPATIGIVDGVATVGLSLEEIERLSNDDGVHKASVRDLPVMFAKKLNAGTTVAATAFLAHKVGIRVFSTGGLGGVHHGANVTFDESADLPTLAVTPIVVVSAGVKSILDVGATLERMETLNIPVVGYKTTKYPGFYVTDSGFEISYSVDSTEEISRLVSARNDLDLTSTILIANPVSVDKQLPPEELDGILKMAWAESAKAGIVGHDTTPFLLDYIQRVTDGRSLEVNIEIYRSNVSLGADIANSLANDLTN